MATQSVSKLFNREGFIQELKEFVQSNKRLSFLINELTGDTGRNVCDLALDKKTEKYFTEFCQHVTAIEESLKDSLEQPIRQEIHRELVQMENCFHAAVYQTADTMFDTLADFFIAKRLVPFLKEAAFRLEARGGAA